MESSMYNDIINVQGWGKSFEQKILSQGERGGWNYQYARIGERGGKHFNKNYKRVEATTMKLLMSKNG